MDGPDIEDIGNVEFVEAIPPADEELELFPVEHQNDEAFFDYKDPLLYNGIMKDVLLNEKEKVLQKISLGKSVRVIDNQGNSLLHLAVEVVKEDDMEMMDILLQQDSIDINAVNYARDTPLTTSIRHRKSFAALKLLEAGADFNFPRYLTSTPLHCCCQFGLSDVGEALICAGANINALDVDGDTPLHLAVLFNQLEMLCMLLCYGADMIRNSGKLTSFELSISTQNFIFADILLEYLTDFNSTTINFAVVQRYPNLPLLIKKFIKYEENYCLKLEMEAWLILFENIEAFKLVWNNFSIDYNLDYPLLEIFHCDSLSWDSTKKIINIILSSEDKIMPKLISISGQYPYLFPVLVAIVEKKYDLEFVREFCTILLSYGLDLWDIDLDIIFEKFGYCDFFYFLLYMDIRFSLASKYTLFPYIIYAVDDRLSLPLRLENHYVKLACKWIFGSRFFNSTLDFDVMFSHSVLPSVISKNIGGRWQDMMKYFKLSDRVPSLSELARNKTRDYLCARYSIKNSREFCCVVKRLDVPELIKKIILFQAPLYRQSLPCDKLISSNREKRWSAIKTHVSCLREGDSSREYLRLFL